MKLWAMKLWTTVAAAVVVMAIPAQAQMGGRRSPGDDSKKAEPVKKIDEKAYKAALERIPDPKEKYDPWAVTKPADAAKPADTGKKTKTP